MGKSDKVPFLPPDSIEDKTRELLRIHHPTLTFPIPIHEIADKKMRLHLDFLAGLRDSIGTDGYLTQDLKTIYIDLELHRNPRLLPRYRFTIAHEVGHIVLHSGIFAGQSGVTIEQYKAFKIRFSEEEWKSLESQAHMFAGFVLVPSDEIEKQVSSVAPEAESKLVRAKASGLSPKGIAEKVTHLLSNQIAPHFHVSPDVMRRRLIFSGMVTDILARHNIPMAPKEVFAIFRPAPSSWDTE